MQEATRTALKQIEDVLIKRDKPEDEIAAKELWNILTALRGPDDMQNVDFKYHYTIPIRRAAFPRITEMPIGMGLGARFELPFASAAEKKACALRVEAKERSLGSPQLHFVFHSRMALAALKD